MGLKIIQMNGTYGNADSTGRNAKEMHEWLIQQGYESEVWTSRVNDLGYSDPNVHIYSSATDRKIHALLSRITGLQGYFSRKATRNLIRAIKNEKDIVVMLGVLHDNSINLPLLYRFLAKNNIPTILVLHDCWYFTGHCCYYSEIDCFKWMTRCKKCPSMHQWNNSWFFNTASKCLRDKQKWYGRIPRLAVVGVSDWILSEAKMSILKNSKQLQRIYNWIDLDVFKPQPIENLRAELNLQDDKPVLLGVAAIWNNKKGLQEMLLAAKKFPNANVVLIGQLPPDVDVPDNVITLGLIKNMQKLAMYYAVADVFLNPSIQETFGKTTAEAICCGTPVVAYKTTACTELVGTERGVLTTLGDADAFMAGIEYVLQCGKQSFETDCVDFAHQNFSKDANINAYVNLAKSLL